MKTLYVFSCLFLMAIVPGFGQAGSSPAQRGDLMFRRAEGVYKTGHFENAAQLYLQAAKLYVEADMPRNILNARNHAARAYRHAFKHSDALNILEQALQDSRRFSDQLRLNLSDTYFEKGSVYMQQSQYQQAIGFLEKALNIRMQELSPTHRATAYVRSTIGECYLAVGKVDDALQFLHMAMSVDSTRKRYTADFCGNLARAYERNGELDKAEFYGVEAVRLRQEMYGEKDIRVGKAYRMLGNHYRINAMPEKALDALQTALTVYLGELGAQHALTAEVYYYLGLTYLDAEKLPEAINAFRSSASIIETSYQGKKRLICPVYYHLGYTFELNRRKENALMYYEKAFEAGKRIYGEDHRALASFAYATGHGYLLNSQADKAMTFFEKAQSLRGNSYDLGAAEIFRDQGTVWQQKTQWDKALASYQKALFCLSPNFRSNDPRHNPQSGQFIGPTRLLFQVLISKSEVLEHVYAANGNEKDLVASLQTLEQALQLAESGNQEFILSTPELKGHYQTAYGRALKLYQATRDEAYREKVSYYSKKYR
ncbi:MAG: tetratricopeptide repeat protein [Bacteroidota bacterium]